MDKRSRLAEIFRDTQRFYTTEPALIAAVEAGRKNTRLYDADKIPTFHSTASKAGSISVTKSRTYEAAMRLAAQYPDKKVAVLNFASATKPGGGVVSGSSAQEESLCRCSTLYPTLDQRFLRQKYYDVNRAADNVLHTDACIYSPGIVICKTDEAYPERMPQEDWVTVDVILVRLKEVLYPTFYAVGNVFQPFFAGLLFSHSSLLSNLYLFCVFFWNLLTN